VDPGDLPATTRSRLTLHIAGYLNPHLLTQTKLLFLKFRQRLCELVRDAGNSFPVSPGMPKLLIQGLLLSSDRGVRPLQLLHQLLQPGLLRFGKTIHEVLVAALRIFHRVLQGCRLVGKVSGVARLRHQLQKLLCLFPGSFRASRQRLELGCLVRRRLNRKRVIEILQTRVAGSCRARRRASATATSAVPSMLAAQVVRTK